MERIYDIIPEAWITPDGCPADSPLPGDRSFIFPSLVEATQDLCLDAPSLLEERNRLPGRTDLRLHCCASCNHAVTVTRSGRNVTFTVEASTITFLRKLSWEDFQAVQKRFMDCLLAASEPRLIVIKLPRERFNEKVLDTKVRKLWLQVLGSAEYATVVKDAKRFAPLDASPPEPSKFPKPARMGHIKLLPGMRLSIHWGGTANYAFGSFPRYDYHRQTTGGRSEVEVLWREGKPVLGSLPSFSAKPVTGNDFPEVGGSDSARARSPVPPASAPPPAPPAPVESAPAGPQPESASVDPNAAALPMGQPTTLGANKTLLTVYNELDIRLQQIRGMEDPNLTPAQLVLYVPAEYTKADFTDSGQNVRQVHDAMNKREKGLAPADILSSLKRRYLLWGGDGSLPDQPDLKPDARWDYTPMAFMNQTQVSVELPVGVNHVTEWVGLGTTLADLLSLHGRTVLARAGTAKRTAPILTLTRSSGPPVLGSITSDTYQYWMLPAESFSSITLRPGDIIKFSP